MDRLFSRVVDPVQLAHRLGILLALVVGVSLGGNGLQATWQRVNEVVNHFTRWQWSRWSINSPWRSGIWFG